MDFPLNDGDVIGGRYQVERVIGTGGMAVVVSAMDLQQPMRVAIKVLLRKAARVEEILMRFQREQRVIQKLDSPYIARLLDAGIHKNAPYMVMEYLQGSDLAEVLRVQGQLPVEQAVEYLLQVCSAVAEAHGYDIVHRDLKPGNLFLTRLADGSPCIKVLDFGIAKILDPNKNLAEDTLTRTSTMMGSPYYMSPEQMISPREVGPKSDIWSLGVILYELLAAAIPFAASSPEKVCARVLNEPPTPLREVRADCPVELEAIILRCLQRAPSKRFSNVAELASALASFGPAHARGIVPFVEALLASPAYAPRPQPSSPDLVLSRDPRDPPEAPTLWVPREKKRVGALRVLVVGGVLMVGGFAAGVVAGRASEEPSAALAPLGPSSVTQPAPPLAPSPADSEPEVDDDPLAAVPIEMDLDEDGWRTAGQRRAHAGSRPSASSTTKPSKPAVVRAPPVASTLSADAESPGGPSAGADASSPVVGRASEPAPAASSTSKPSPTSRGASSAPAELPVPAPSSLE